MRSPTSSVGAIDAEGMDLGSANEDLNKKLILKAVRAALVSSEQQLNNLLNQLPLVNSFPLSASTKRLLVSHLPSICCSTLFPTLITLHGNHLEACKNGRINEAFNCETPNDPLLPGTRLVDLSIEDNPTAKGELEALQSSPAREA